MKWEQLEIPIIGVTETLHRSQRSSRYGQFLTREGSMLKITIGINEMDLYEVEAYNQGINQSGICDYKVVVNGEEVGVLRHDRADGAWPLAQEILNRMPIPEKNLMEEGGAHSWTSTK